MYVHPFIVFEEILMVEVCGVAVEILFHGAFHALL